jgi:hypothetical protein
MPRMANPTADQTAKNAQEMLKDLVWPPADRPGAGISLANLLVALQLLATDEDRADAVKAGQKWDADTPGSLQVLKSGVTGVTKWWAKRAGVLGGAAGALAAVSGVVIGAVKPFREALGEPLVVALIGGGALILSATLLALAHFVNADLTARAHATAARSAARAEVAATFLRAAAASSSDGGDRRDRGRSGGDTLRQELLAVFAASDHVYVRTKGSSSWVEATGMQVGEEDFQVRTANGDWKPLAEVQYWTTDPR